MDKIPNPNIAFDTSPPAYREITKIIMKLRSSASPCPYVQIRTIVLKKCPILRIYLCQMLANNWLSNAITVAWKDGITRLTYKKGEANNPDKFRPITLELVLQRF